MGKQNDTGVYQLKDGNWGFRFKVVVNGKPVFKKRSKDEAGNLFETKSTAIKARKKAINAEKDKEGLQPYRVVADTAKEKTVAEVFAEYCEKGRKDRAFSTIYKQDNLWKNHLSDAFGARRINEISTAEIQDYLAKLYYEDGYAFMYVESFLKMFYLIFGQAYSRGYLETADYRRLCVNKDTKIHMPKMKCDEDTDIHIFTAEQLETLDEYFCGSNSETAYLLGRYCGLRINECYGLKWEQVDLEAGTIRIEQQMAYQKGIIKLVPLKTRNARRTVYLCDKIKAHLKMLAAQREEASPEQHQRQEQNQTFVINADGSKTSSLALVNCLPSGKIQTINSMKYHSRTIKERFGFDFKYHYLRHTYGTHLATLNTPAHILCGQMGHGKIETTRKYYIVLSQKGLETLISNINQM